MRARIVRIVSVVLTLLLAVAWVVYLRPSVLGGPATYVIVSGTSMLPTLESGDLVVAFERDSYAIGEVVVYEVPSADPGKGTKIVHRLVGGSAETGYLARGDSREGLDYWRPKREEVLGTMRLHVPWVGRPLAFLQQPAGLALAAALTTFLLALGGSTRTSRKSGGNE